MSAPTSTCPPRRLRLRPRRPRRPRLPLSSGYVGILSVELHFPEAGSLKGKRKFVASAKAQLANRFGAAVAEVDHHELWQRSRLTLAIIAREAGEAGRLLDEAERWLNGQDFVFVSCERRILTLDD